MNKKTIMLLVIVVPYAILVISSIVFVACSEEDFNDLASQPESTAVEGNAESELHGGDETEEAVPDDTDTQGDDATSQDEWIDTLTTRRHTVTSEEINIEGFSGFAIDLAEGYILEPWLSEPGWYQVSYQIDGNWLMRIGQSPNIGMTVREYMDNMVAEWEADGLELSYVPPTAEFPFYVSPREIASGEGNIMQSFTRDNNNGGVFHIIILLFPNEWEEGHGPRLMNSLELFEVLAG